MDFKFPSLSSVHDESFIMPYNLQCEGCGSIIAKGVKLRAKQELSYCEGKTWSLKLKCPCCGHKIVMDEVPQPPEYIVVNGGHKVAADEHLEKPAGGLDNTDQLPFYYIYGSSMIKHFIEKKRSRDEPTEKLC